MRTLALRDGGRALVSGGVKALVLVLLVALTACGGTASSSQRTITVARLPAEAQRTLALIDRGGPFPYRQDGTVFSNRERLLPAEPSGYYREYTVPTPGSADRGARRLIGGKNGERYYTADHYRTFARVTR